MIKHLLENLIYFIQEVDWKINEAIQTFTQWKKKKNYSDKGMKILQV